jgi:hypothetical protein
MPKKIVLMGLFTDVLKTSDALDGLRLLGLREEDMSILQGVPYTSKMLGRPHIHEKVPWASIIGALTGTVIALFLTYGTQWLYPIRVGGRPLTAIPTSIIPIYELTMLGLVLGTFLNMVWKCGFPSTKPQYYDMVINHSRIAVLCNCDMRYEDDVRRVLLDKGAERVYEPERRPL